MCFTILHFLVSLYIHVQYIYAITEYVHVHKGIFLGGEGDNSQGEKDSIQRGNIPSFLLPRKNLIHAHSIFSCCDIQCYYMYS